MGSVDSFFSVRVVAVYAPTQPTAAERFISSADPNMHWDALKGARLISVSQIASAADRMLAGRPLTAIVCGQYSAVMELFSAPRGVVELWR